MIIIIAKIENINDNKGFWQYNYVEIWLEKQKSLDVDIDNIVFLKFFETKNKFYAFDWIPRRSYNTIKFDVT